MTETPTPKTNYSGTKKATETLPEKVEARLQKIEGLSVVKTKPGIGKRIKESFGGQDLKSVGLYLVLEVMVPASRDLLFDLIKEGGHRAIYGDTSRRSSSGTNSILGGNRIRPTSYSSMSAPSLSGNRRPGDTNLNPLNRPKFDFDEFVIGNREDAQEVLERMTDAIEEFGVVTVADFYDLMGVSGNGFTDQKMGWDAKGFNGVDVKKVREGYILELPNPRGIQ